MSVLFDLQYKGQRRGVGLLKAMLDESVTQKMNRGFRNTNGKAEAALASNAFSDVCY